MDEMKNLSLIYENMGDSLSKMLLTYRLGYSFSGGDQQFVNKIIRMNSKLDSFYKLLESLSGDKVIYSVGTRGRALSNVCSNVNFKYFIDKEANIDVYNGIPVKNIDEFLNDYRNEYIIIVSSKYRNEMLKKLKEYSIPRYKILCYCDVVAECYECYEDQYFDLPNMAWCAEEIFVDMGCWDGNTDVLLKHKIGDKLKKCIVFEASLERFDICKDCFHKNNIDYEFIPKGAYSREGVLHLRLADDGQVSTSVGEECEIKVTSLDRVLDGRGCTFIKMDIEGSELQALIGSTNTIKKYTPKMAIAVYHKPEDIYKIPLKILEINSNYKFYLRHYQHTALETVLYAIPKD